MKLIRSSILATVFLIWAVVLYIAFQMMYRLVFGGYMT